MNMPPLCGFDPRPAVWRWLNDKNRRQRQTPKASKQDWFINVFESDEVGQESTERDEAVAKKF